MSLPDEIQKLRDLHQSGALTAAEFEAAKARLLNAGASPAQEPGHRFVPPPLPPASIYAPPQTAAGNTPEALDTTTRQWALALHLSQFAGYVVPLAGLVVPIVIWQIKKKDLPGPDVHGCHVTNWIITELLLAIVFGILCLVFIGIPLLIALGVAGVIFPIIGAVKANSGEAWRYPVSITFFRPELRVMDEPPRPHGW